jgi:alkanesulfonate monooxygenase SsuD/methylene tetrahydromethanopterin reductase-like flavin-dependent oxidoreductase (luciferase family)
MMYPVPFASKDDIVRVAIESEQLGYYEVAGNDHFTTQRYVRETFADPPDFFDPLISYAYCAAKTSVLRLMTGIIVVPLDQFSDGRVIVGAGIGAYREELEACFPDLAGAKRADLMRESLEALRLLLEERNASYAGEYIRFDDVEMFPKPVQKRLPIYSAGNSDGAIKRAAQIGDGWLPAGIAADRIGAAKEKLARYAQEAGRDPSTIKIAPQLIVCIGEDAEEARRTFEGSQLYEHLVSLQQSTLKNVSIDEYMTTNLVGTPDQICKQVAELEAVGVDHLCGLYFVGNTVDEMMDQVRLFGREVLPNFPDKVPAAA